MNIFSFIKSNVPILEVVQQYTSLKQAGSYWRGICPFHNERTPSFTVSPNRDIFYCFGCQEGGDVVYFTAKVENCSQFEAAKMLSEKYNIKVPQEILKEIENQEYNLDAKSKYAKLCSLITKWCQLNLAKNREALTYLESRKIDKESIERFEIGYFQPGQAGLNSLNNFLKKENILFQDLAEFSIILDGNSGFYSPFEDRIIFPIKNSLSENCGFGGRIFKKDDERAKYYNSKENPYFNKGSILFGFDMAKKHIQKEKSAFLVEGYMDCVAMAQNGYKNCVATLGTACTIEHLKVLSRFIDKLYVIYDSDKAGNNAILRLTEIAWNVNLELKIVSLPNGEDPASFFAKNLNLNDFVSKSKNIYQYFINSAKSEFLNSSLSEKLQKVEKITKIIDQLNDPIKKTLLFQEVSQEFGIALDLIVKGKKNSINVSPQKESEFNSLEKTILGMILRNTKLLKDEKVIEIIEFLPEKIQKILNLAKNIDEFDFKDFVRSLEDDSKKMALESYMQNDENIDLSKILIQFHKKNWKNIIIKLKKDLSEEKDTQKKYLILSKLKDWQKKILPGSFE